MTVKKSKRKRQIEFITEQVQVVRGQTSDAFYGDPTGVTASRLDRSLLGLLNIVSRHVEAGDIDTHPDGATALFALGFVPKGWDEQAAKDELYALYGYAEEQRSDRENAR